MRIDVYTRVILTIIAACLVYLSFGGRAVMPVARAEADGSRVLITGWVDADGRIQRLPSPPSAGGALALPAETFRR
jgi:hypothetical protein